MKTADVIEPTRLAKITVPMGVGEEDARNGMKLRKFSISPSSEFVATELFCSVLELVGRAVVDVPVLITDWLGVVELVELVVIWAELEVAEDGKVLVVAVKSDIPVVVDVWSVVLALSSEVELVVSVVDKVRVLVVDAVDEVIPFDDEVKLIVLVDPV